MTRARREIAATAESAFEQVVSAQAMGYLADMGIDAELFAIMARIPPDEIRLLTRAESLQPNLVNGGEAPSGSPWGVAAK